MIPNKKENATNQINGKNYKIIEIDKILPNQSNPRFINDSNFKKLVKSIKEFPQMLEMRPIVVNKEMKVLGGNMRLKACVDAGLKEVPILVADAFTEEQEKEFIIKDNIGFGDWDWDILANEWNAEHLVDWGIETPDGWGIELNTEDDEFEIPDEIETDIVIGDLFEIGEHRLLCGDSTDKEQVSKLMDGNKSDIVFTDPPYNVDYGANKFHPHLKIRPIENDKLSDDAWELFCRAFIDVIKDFNKGDVYVWTAPGPEGMKLGLWLVDSGCHWSASIIWKKDHLILSPAKYQRMYEPCFYGWFNKSSFVGDRKQVEVWEVDRPKKSKEHPTMKPLKLCDKGISNSSKIGDIVLDLFLGSGSTMVASHQLKRKCYGMELDPKYCQVIINRMIKSFPDLIIKKNGEVPTQ